MGERRPSTFRQRDISRAIKAARQAGEKGALRVHVDGDKLTVIAYPPGEEPSVGTPLDKWLKAHAGADEGD